MGGCTASVQGPNPDHGPRECRGLRLVSLPGSMRLSGVVIQAGLGPPPPRSPQPVLGLGFSSPPPPPIQCLAASGHADPRHSPACSAGSAEARGTRHTLWGQTANRSAGGEQAAAGWCGRMTRENRLGFGESSARSPPVMSPHPGAPPRRPHALSRSTSLQKQGLLHRGCAAFAAASTA